MAVNLGGLWSQQGREQPGNRIPEADRGIALSILRGVEFRAVSEVVIESRLQFPRELPAVDHRVDLIVDAEAADIDIG